MKTEGNKSEEKLRKKIDEAFNQLERFIEKIPLNKKGKNYIWQHSFTQFYDSYLSSETGEPTYGIQTEWQLKCFKKQFNENIKHLKIKRMEAYSLELDNLPPLAANDKVSRQLREIKRKRLLEEIGGAKPTEWDDWLQKYLSEEKLFIAERNDNTTPPKETPIFENHFDKVAPNEVYKHFKAGLLDKGYLTEQELNGYLKTAFESQTIPETLFKLKQTPTKQKIYNVFYEYYKDVSETKHGTRTQYADLLGNYFEGYKTSIIQTNWAKEYKAKR